MADLKSITVEYLRELARKHLGRGHSKLKTKEDLLGALVELVPGLAKLAGVEKPKAAKEPKAAKGQKAAKESKPTREPKAARESTPTREAKAAKGQKAAKETTPVKKARPSVKKQVQDKVKAVREKVRGSRKAPVAISAASRTEKPGEQPVPPAPVEKKRPLPGDDDEKTPIHHPPRPAEVVTFPPKPKSPARPAVGEEPTLPPSLAEPGVSVPAPAVASAPLEPSVPVEPAHPVQHAAEPLVEGFFVARMAGEQEVFRHHLSESQGQRPAESLGSPDYHERLGELSLDYADDTALLLARDPHTLFVLWDFSAAARQRALEGLESPRAVLRVYDNQDVLLRVIDVALESRSYYIHGLPSGHPYRVEVHFVGTNGRSRRIGHSSNRVTLPPVGPSPDTSVRFLRMPPIPRVMKNLEAQAATAPTRTAPVEEREYITWRRIPLPGSGGFEDIPERHRERIVPGVPGEGASEQPYLEAPRFVGSSEQWAGFGGPGGGSSEQWAKPGGPAGGSSEQWAGLGGPGGGASEQWVSSHPSGGTSERWEWVWTRPSTGVSEYRTWSTSPSGQGR